MGHEVFRSMVSWATKYFLKNLPSDWKSPNITPIYKKDDKSDPENYHPVSSTSVLCKIMELVIEHHLRKYLKDKNIILNKQYGFLLGRSTVLH